MGALDCVTPQNKISSTESTEVFGENKLSNISLNTPTRDVESQAAISRGNEMKGINWWWIWLDLPLLITFLTLIGIYESGVIPGYKSGFFCNDPALSYRYTGDTVSTALLMCGVLFFPPAIFLITEFMLSEEESCKLRAYRAIRATITLYKFYQFGFIFNAGVIEFTKGVAGKPRPTFFDLCEPDTAKTCTGTEFVSNFVCTSQKYSAWMQSDSYRSFPSGHTSFSVYCGFFIAWYLQRRAFSWRNRSVLLVPFVQLMALLFSIVSSVTRVTDFRHHWWDVVAGTILGWLCVLYAVALCNNFSTRSLGLSKDTSRVSRRLV